MHQVPAGYHGLSQSAKKQLQITQNKITRFIMASGNRAHVGPDELLSLNKLNVENSVKQLQLNIY